MRVETSYTYESPKGEIELELVANVRLGRPAPPCSNPDSPAFSDSGDPSEVEVLECWQAIRVGAETFRAAFVYDHLSIVVRDKIEDYLVQVAADLDYEASRGPDEL